MRKIEERFGITSARYKHTECFRRIKPEKLAYELRRGNVDDLLLLDVRDKDEFASFHLREARNYPGSMMSRSIYQFTPEILDFTNKEGKLMVLYDLEEKVAAAVGTAWYEKGIDNFVVMSGGLLAMARTHPDLIEGDLPMHLVATSGICRRRVRPAPATLYATDQNAHVNTRQGGAGSRARLHTQATAGMTSASSAARSQPRPAHWNSLRASAPLDMRGSFNYTRSFDSNTGF